jgi:predicted membrane protein
MKIRKFRARRNQSRTYSREQLEDIKGAEIDVIKTTSRYLLFFLVFAISLELLDLIFRGYTAVKSWDVLRSVIYGKDFVDIFILQYGIGNLIPLILFLLPRLSIRRATIGAVLVLFGVFMMRWNVVIGGQAFSLTFAGYMHYALPMIPRSLDTLKEGLVGALGVFVFPFILFYLYSKIMPIFGPKETY